MKASIIEKMLLEEIENLKKDFLEGKFRLLERCDADAAATKLASALKDIYNDVGNIPEVRLRFDEVADIVAEYAGKDDG